MRDSPITIWTRRHYEESIVLSRTVIGPICVINDPAAIRQCSGVETLQRHLDRAGNALDREFIRLAHINEQDFTCIHSVFHFFNAEIFYRRMSHTLLPNRENM